MRKGCVETIGYYGGSFDMPTLGHTQMADNFLKSGLLDRLIVSPAGRHALGKNYGV
jgi:nicotinic acid mononucleotide adenylyltransferase